MSASARTPKINHRDDESFARRAPRRTARRQNTRHAVVRAALLEEV